MNGIRAVMTQIEFYLKTCYLRFVLNPKEQGNLYPRVLRALNYTISAALRVH